jgi:hypothetical protein
MMPGRLELTDALERAGAIQADMWDLTARLQPVRGMKAGATRAKLAALAGRQRLLCIAFQLGDLELERDVPNGGFAIPVEFRNFDDFEAYRDSGVQPDIALFRSHMMWRIDGNYDFNPLVEAPRVAGDCVNLVWLWDHHHDFASSGKMALLADIVLPMHENHADYLKAFNDFIASAVPAASAQWGGPRFVHDVYREHADRPRSNRLYGGFVEYPGVQRNDLIRRCMERIPDHALVLLPPSGARDIQHFGVASRRDRLVEWMGHKCSLVCALKEDIPIRVLDGLLAGHIPLVPHNLNGFDRLISPALQAQLPIVRYYAYDVDAVESAWRTAIALYDRDGAAGAERRQRFVLENHLMKHRVTDIVASILNCAWIFPDR